MGDKFKRCFLFACFSLLRGRKSYGRHLHCHSNVWYKNVKYLTVPTLASKKNPEAELENCETFSCLARAEFLCTAIR